MALDTPELRALTAAIDAALDEPVGYIAIEWALRRRGYFLTPSYRRSAEEWTEHVRRLFPDGRVQVTHDVKPHTPELLVVERVENQDDRVVLVLGFGHGSGWAADVTDAEYVDGALIGATVAGAPGHGLVLRRGFAGPPGP